MNFLEKDLEEIIFTADKEKLSDRGLYFYPHEKLKRQVRIGNYGIADLVGIKKPFYHPIIKEKCKGQITVYELKKDRISISTFMQAANYLHGIKRYLTIKGYNESYDYCIRLIGKEIDSSSSFVYLPDLITNHSYDETITRDSIFRLESYLYSYDIDGLRFDEINGFKLINEGF